jgi:hypothetical protein
MCELIIYRQPVLILSHLEMSAQFQRLLCDSNKNLAEMREEDI